MRPTLWSTLCYWKTAVIVQVLSAEFYSTASIVEFLHLMLSHCFTTCSYSVMWCCDFIQCDCSSWGLSENSKQCWFHHQWAVPSSCWVSHMMSLVSLLSKSCFFCSCLKPELMKLAQRGHPRHAKQAIKCINVTFAEPQTMFQRLFTVSTNLFRILNVLSLSLF